MITMLKHIQHIQSLNKWSGNRQESNKEAFQKFLQEKYNIMPLDLFFNLKFLFILLNNIISYMRQKSTISSIVTGLTLGIVNYGSDGIILKDPITGIGNILAHGKDAFFHQDMTKGVWIGKRTISGFGFSSYATQFFNSNVLHYAFMIDGEAFHLKGEKGRSSGSGTLILIQRLNQDKSSFQWFYKGKTKHNATQIYQLIKQVNKLKMQYHLYFSNCQDVAKSFCYYARGLCFKQEVQQIILPTLNEIKILKYSGGMRVFQFMTEVINLIA